MVCTHSKHNKHIYNEQDKPLHPQTNYFSFHFSSVCAMQLMYFKSALIDNKKNNDLEHFLCLHRLHCPAHLR